MSLAIFLSTSMVGSKKNLLTKLGTIFICSRGLELGFSILVIIKYKFYFLDYQLSNTYIKALNVSLERCLWHIK